MGRINNLLKVRTIICSVVNMLLITTFQQVSAQQRQYDVASIPPTKYHVLRRGQYQYEHN